MFQVPSTITKITTLADKSIRLQVDTQELSAEEKALVFGLHERFGWFVFKETLIEQKDIELPELPNPKKDGKEKTDSQRLRAVIYLLWKQNGEKDLYSRECDGETYYHQYMNHIIEKAKSRLERK